MKLQHSILSIATAAGILTGCDFSDELVGGVVVPFASAALSPRAPAANAEYIDIRNRTLNNPIAYITSQCFTRTQDEAGRTHNPCFSCHIPSAEPNYLDDGDLQLGYDFPGDEGAIRENPWSNLFKDRTNAVAAIDDERILAYVRQDNYAAADGGSQLARLLTAALPTVWDVNGNGRWDGYLPDAGFNFDAMGFDHLADGSYTGWRAFAYAPFLGTFWPTNGSTDDVLIRLAPAFWQTEAGQPDLTVYKTNLAIVTAMIQRRDVVLDAPVDETVLQVDLDKDGRLALANTVRYDWAPLQGKYMYYVGKARVEQANGRVHLAAGLFPEGTEFLHSVRYLDPDENGGIGLARRFKELRYAVKQSWYTYSDLKEMALKEQREKVVNPERTRQLTGNAEIGMSNGQGWTYQGFIEDRNGALRPQTYEETVFCIGCHGGTGATTDSAFSFPRKFAESAQQGGWYHWTQHGLAGTAEPVRRDGQPEYAHYLAQNGAGDEFRENREVMARFFDGQGNLLGDMLARLRDDMSVLLFPSRARALSLDKAYRVIVDEQSFVFGRDATIAPAQNVHRSIVLGTRTGLRQVVEGP